VLTSFETFDTLAGRDRPLIQVTGEVVGLVIAALREDPTLSLENGAETDD
jgi:hypothetical protein